MTRPEPPFTRELDLLATQELTIIGRVTESSNLTFVVEFGSDDDYAWGVYKPEVGERPLHDFPPGLHARERAAFLLSESLGWHLVPPTVVRSDAPAGVGSVQWFVENDGEHYFTLWDGHADTHDALRRLAVFDVITNNTDRKSGHVLLDADRRVWGIDHGLCFGAFARLRTVIWDFAGDPLPDDVLVDLAPLADGLPPEVAELLDDHEAELVRRRVRRLLRDPVLPYPTTDYAYPWPLV
ncbi:SCO1664 family protein [Propioniciclava soli]|uniref:SCO1664 family protein n=1 Tax=Propioniciclava soli TaxID=2775081 RepID=A0ABZ3CF46_9ACTN|nr:SCO1664 family protein [Propioniciclava soli]